MDTTAQNVNPPPAKKNKLFPLAITIVVLLGLGTVMVLSLRHPENTARPASSAPTAGPSPTPTLIPRPTLGSMTLKTKDGATRYQAGKPLTIIILAGSEGKRIVGYDAILSYDNTGFSYQSSKSVAADFQLYAYDRKTYVSFSGIRSLQSTASDSWSAYPLIEVQMTAKKAGNYVFELSPEGKEASKLVDDKAQVVYPKTEQLHLEIY